MLAASSVDIFFSPPLWSGLEYLFIYYHEEERMKPNDFGIFLAIPVAPPAGQSFPLSCEISLHLTDSHRTLNRIHGPY